MAKESPRFYVFHGEDEFRLSQAIDKMRQEMREVDSAGLNIAEMDGTSVNAAEVLSAVSAFPFLADRRLVIVKNMLTWITRKGAGETGKKQVERFEEDLPALPESARLIFVENKSLPASNKLLKLAQTDPHGYEKEFSAPKDITGWLIKHAQNVYDVVLEPTAAKALASVVGSDLRRADNELLKLVSYTGGQPIEEDVVTLLTPYTSETRIWDMIDAMATGNGNQAMAMLHQILDEPDEDPFRVWALFVRQFRLMLLAREHLDDGGQTSALPGVLSAAPFQAQKISNQIRAFSLEELEEIYRKLLDYDSKIKTGRMDIVLALDVLIASIAR